MIIQTDNRYRLRDERAFPVTPTTLYWIVEVRYVIHVAAKTSNTAGLDPMIDSSTGLRNNPWIQRLTAQQYPRRGMNRFSHLLLIIRYFAQQNSLPSRQVEE